MIHTTLLLVSVNGLLKTFYIRARKKCLDQYSTIIVYLPTSSFL